jgi:uncharacterized membrane protein YoaK (UPF0700 family)
MKRAWRFIKWCVTDMKLIDWYILLISFCVGAEIAAMTQGDEDRTHFWLGAIIVIVTLAMVTFMLSGIASAWKRFKEDDERAFTILKDKDLK